MVEAKTENGLANQSRLDLDNFNLCVAVGTGCVPPAAGDQGEKVGNRDCGEGGRRRNGRI